MNIPYDQFETDPRRFLTFCETNLVCAGSLDNSSCRYGMPDKVALVPAEKSDRITTGAGVFKNGKNCDIFGLINVVGHTPGLRAYICDYLQGEICYQILSRKAKFCFTTNMNGCTFGIGSRTPEGDVLVTHCNADYRSDQIKDKRDDPYINPPSDDQSVRQMDTLRAFYGPGTLSTWLAPAAYRDTKQHESTTFGIRLDTGWQFYYQKRHKIGSGYSAYCLDGVFPITTNQHGNSKIHAAINWLRARLPS